MRVTATHVLLVVVLLTALLLAVDPAAAADVAPQQIDCWPSAGGGIIVCG